MKFQQRIRTQMMLMGLGAALLLANSARAQQDTDPTYFEITPSTPKVNRGAVPRAAHNSGAASGMIAEAAAPVSTLGDNDSTLEAEITQVTLADMAAVLILMAGIGSIVLYAMAATRRRLQVSPPSAPYAPASGAIAHRTA